MNREQKRALKNKGNKIQKGPRGKVNLKKKNRETDEIYIPEGTKVKLNIKRIKEHPDYLKLTEDYRNFVEMHEDTIFTVEYDNFRKNPSTLVCLKEDPTPLKWLFWTGNLIEV
jgi:hypothetical protein